MDGQLEIPDWKKFIPNGNNKANLLKFTGNSWIEQHASLPYGKCIIIGDPEKIIAILSKDTSEILSELSCSQHEEADTSYRMFAHLNYTLVKTNCTAAMIQSLGTDVALLAIFYATRLPSLTELWIQKVDCFILVHSIVLNYAKLLKCTL